MVARNPRFNASGGIDCEIEHPDLGWIAHTARPDDEATAQLFADLASTAAPFEPAPEEPEADYVPTVISRFQARAALMGAGLLADAELAIGSAGPLAQLAWAEAVEWRRDSPTIAAVADALGLTAAEVDALFRAAAQITA